MYFPRARKGQRGRNSLIPETYWGPDGQYTVTPSSKWERESLRGRSQLYDPNYQYASQQEFRDAMNRHPSGMPGMPMFGPGGPPGGPAKVGMKMQGPMGNVLPGNTQALAWTGIPQSQVPGAAGSYGQGPLQWPGIPQSVQAPVRADTQPVGGGQMAQAAALRQRVG